MFTVKDIATKLNVSVGAVYKAIVNGELECHRFGSAIRVSDPQLQEFMEFSKNSTQQKELSRGLKHL